MALNEVPEQVERGVLGLTVSYQEYDTWRPWMKRNPATRSAQAALVEGGLLLTTAQMVAGATMVEVEREGRPPRAAARVVHEDRELNLALLVVDEPGFLDGLEPLPLAAETPVSGTVHAVRWNHQQFEVAAIRVKRMGVAEVWYGRLRHAFLLGKSDLPDGGWAEPVVDGGELVGLTSGQDDHTAWIVPVEILAAYLAQARDPERYVGFAVIRFQWQWTMDRGVAGWLGLDEPRGVLVRRVPRGSTGDGELLARDVLLSLDGHEIDSRGYYLHPRFGWLEFTHVAVDGHRQGDLVPARVLRGGRPVDLQVTLRGYPTLLDLVVLRRGNEPPPYVVAGGLVFVELDADYARAWGREWWNAAPLRLVAAIHLQEGRQEPDRRRIVVLSQVLPSPWSVGYQDCHDLLVHAVDGREVDSLEDLVEALDGAAGPHVRIDFVPNETRAHLVIDATTLQATTQQNLEDFRIPAARRLAGRPPPLEP